MSIEDSITYPMEDDDWIVTVLIGGGLSLLGFLLVPLFPVYGYVVRAIRATLDGESEPPSFDDWGELFVDGLQAAIIGLVYMLVPLIVMTVTVGGSVAALASGGEAAAATGVGGLLVGVFLTSVLALLFGYLSTIAVVNFAREERFGAAFDLGVVGGVALDTDFAVPWLLSVAVFLAASLVNAIPFVGPLLAVFAGFYAAVVAANLWADGFSQALDAGGPYGRTDLEETAV